MSGFASRLRLSAILFCSTLVVSTSALAVPIPLPGFPLKVEGTVREPVTTADLDRDGSTELIVVHGSKLSVLNVDGRVWPGWPVDVATALRAKGIDFNASVHGERGAATILGDTVYVPFGGHFGDCGAYRGAVVGVNRNDPKRVTVWQADALGGAVWAQFPASAKFGADMPRRITTGRGIVVPGTPLPGSTGPAKPQSVTLREFELLYRVIYLPRPAISATEATDIGGGRRGGVRADVADRPEVFSDGSPPPTPCREI